MRQCKMMILVSIAMAVSIKIAELQSLSSMYQHCARHSAN